MTVSYLIRVLVPVHHRYGVLRAMGERGTRTFTIGMGTCTCTLSSTSMVQLYYWYGTGTGISSVPSTERVLVLGVPIQ